MTKLTAIDESNRDHHTYLTAADNCYFLLEYTSGQNFRFSDTNSLISNLKKKPSEHQRPGYGYKARAIRECGDKLSAALNPRWLATAVLVPVPGSKVAGHPDFDDRIEQICRSIRPQPASGVRNIVRQTATTEAFHAGPRMRPDELVQLYAIDETLCHPAPEAIGIVDDVLTAGTHFRAMHTVLSQRFPGVSITGIFVARRVPSPTVDPEDWFE